MHILYLTQEEKEVLRDHRKTSPIALIRDKAMAALMRDKRIPVAEIAELLQKGKSTILRWTSDYKKRRMASIFSGLQNNDNASKLTQEQKEEIRKTLEKPPSERSLPREFWDVPQLKEYIKAEFGTEYKSKQTYHYLLRFSNLSFKQPATFDIRRDDEQVKLKVREIRKEILPRMSDENWVILASDETRLMLEAITRRAWLKKGEKTVLKVERSKESQYYIGFLNLKTGRDHLLQMAWGNEEETIKAVEHIAHIVYPDKNICIIWDNVSYHKGKKLREKLRKGQSLERVHLINFPPYAPDSNPQEAVWNRGKNHISNTQFKTFADTKRSFESFVSTHVFDYTI